MFSKGCKMNPLRVCTEQLGIRLVEAKFTNNDKVQSNLKKAACYSANTVVAFSDVVDVMHVNKWREKKGDYAPCTVVAAKDGILYYANGVGDDKEIEAWERVLCKDNPLECMICMISKRNSRDLIECGTCHALHCKSCDVQMSSPLCAFCRIKMRRSR